MPIYLPNSGRKRLPAWVSIALLAVLAIVTAVVVVLAMMHMRSPVPNAGSLPETSAEVEQPTPEPVPEPVPEPQPAPEEPVAVAPISQRLLAVAADDTHILRATIGSCTDPAGVLETSFDGGVTWQQGSTAALGATKLLQFDTTNSGMDRLVALDAACEVVLGRSFIGGVDWARIDEGVSWFIDQSNTSAVSTPSGTQVLPCGAAGLASAGARAVVLCQDSTVTVSEDEGVTWSSPVAVPSGAAVGIIPTGYLVVSSAESECAGVRTRTFDGSTLSEAGACIDRSDAGDGNIAVTGGTTGSFLWVGDAVLRSGDLGQTWG